jgi:two-component system response regulator HydG
MTKAILIIEDDITFGMMLKTWLEKKGFQVSSASNIARAQKQIDLQNVDLILSDLRLPDHDGIYLLQWMIEKKIKTPLIIMTGYADIQSAVQAIKLGAKDYIAKPVNPEELLKKINEAFQKKYVPKEPPPISVPEAKNKQNFLEGESDAAKQLYNYVALVAPTNMSVLIIGASGTGKEYVAQRIHQLSKRNEYPFIAIDCGAIPKELATSEFFGHIKGSFTGAIADKDGAFVAANGGTLFLDEIGNLSYETQVQLLRALQERKIRPVGSNEEITVDIRLVAATNENLEEAIERGSFREDLFHRINEFTLRIPNLKDRKEDILLFANFFLDRANKELSKQLIGFDAKASSTLQDYHWPGNLRQMQNVIKRATLLAQGNFITLAELASELSDTPTTSPTLSLRNEESEKEQILEAIKQSGNNKSKAAQMLGIDRKTLYNKLKLHDIKL